MQVILGTESIIPHFFLSVLKVSTQFFHDADFIGAAYMAKTRKLFTYYCYSQAEPIEQNSSLLLSFMFPYVLKIFWA